MVPSKQNDHNFHYVKSEKLLDSTIQSWVFTQTKDSARVIILRSPANSQREFAPNLQYCEF